MEDIKTYELLITNEDEQGIVRFSLVEDPANQTEFIMLSEEDVVLKMASDEEQVLVGPLLIPGQVIGRKDSNGNSYNLFFSEEKVLELGRNMMRKGNNQNIDIRHNGQNVSGMYTQETWFAGADDKAHKWYPKEKIKKNTLMVGVHIPDKETWTALKASGLKGFSIEAISGLKEMMEEMDRKVAMESHQDKWEEMKTIMEKEISDEEKIGRLKQLLGVE